MKPMGAPPSPNPNVATPGYQSALGPWMTFSVFLPYFVATALQDTHLQIGLIVATALAGAHVLLGALTFVFHMRRVSSIWDLHWVYSDYSAWVQVSNHGTDQAPNWHPRNYATAKNTRNELSCKLCFQSLISVVLFFLGYLFPILASPQFLNTYCAA